MSEDEKSISVISERYLEQYWASNYDREEPRSLSAEEVLFIIEDSIRLYQTYDMIVLAPFTADSPNEEIKSRFPNVEEQRIYPELSNGNRSYEDDVENIFSIIFYRMMVLSSPKVYITAMAGAEFTGKDPFKGEKDELFPSVYICEYTENLDREYMLRMMGGGTSYMGGLTEFKQSGFFGFSYNDRFTFYSFRTGQKPLKVFPTEAMTEAQSVFTK